MISVDNPDYVGQTLNLYISMLETKTKKVLSSHNYLAGFTKSFDLIGNLLEHKRMEIKQTSLELNTVLAINNQNAVKMH